MIVFYVATKVIDTEKFPQHTNADLNSGITFIVLFSQENKHTHTHTHTQRERERERDRERKSTKPSSILFFVM